MGDSKFYGVNMYAYERYLVGGVGVLPQENVEI